jgi:hypothetical protein
MHLKHKIPWAALIQSNHRQGGHSSVAKADPVIDSNNHQFRISACCLTLQN